MKCICSFNDFVVVVSHTGLTSKELWPQFHAISKTLTFEVPKFSQNFSPLRFRWILPAGLGHGAAASRGVTPLHYAAYYGDYGHVSVLERLIEAKAAVDVKEKKYGRGLGRGFGGNPLEAMGFLRAEVDGMLMVQVLLDASLFCGSVLPKHLALRFCVFLCHPDCTVPTA